MSESEPPLSDLPVPVDPIHAEDAVTVTSSAPDDNTRREDQSRSFRGERLLRYVRLAWLRTVRTWRSFLRDQVTPVRLASHIALLLMAVAVIVLSRIELPRWDIVRVAPLQAEDIGILPEPAFDQLPVGGSPLQEGGVLLRGRRRRHLAARPPRLSQLVRQRRPYRLIARPQRPCRRAARPHPHPRLRRLCHRAARQR